MVCGAGKYGVAPEQTAAASCMACGAGKYGVATEQTAEASCMPCGAGKYGVATEQTAEASCTACGVGKYGVATEQTAEASCMACGAGKYRVETGGSSETSCTTCGTGTYSTAVGLTICSVCPSNSNSPPGSSALSACICNAGSSGADGGSCTQCVAGKYKAGAGNGDCMACGAGKYGVVTGQTAEEWCTTCGAGKYRVETGGSAEASCTACGAGTYRKEGSAESSCTGCGAGKYRVETGGSSEGSCASCGTGKYRVETGGSSEGSCTVCNVGKYGTATGQTAEASCSPCGAGKYRVETGGSSEASCTVCGAGKYGVATGQTTEASCTACGVGKYGVATGKTSEASCTDCGAGKYQVETGGSSEASCTVCGTGKYGFGTGQTLETSCTDCGAGKYGVSTGQTAEASCTVCIAGKYGVETGRSSEASCTSCGAGKYGVGTGRIAEASCRVCDASKYGVDTQQTSCLACPPYSNSPPGSTSVTTCTCNTGSTGPSGGPCSQCAAGKFKDTPGTDACITCLVGKYGAVGAAAESECLACPAGKFGGREGSSTCAVCEAGKVSDRGEVVCRRSTETGYVVKLVLSLPLAKSEFTEDKQSKFRQSIATAAGSKSADVTIDAIDTILTSVGRRLLSELVLVHITITAADVEGADAIASSLTTDRINAALENAGLPKATIKQAPTVETVSTATSVNTSTAPLIGGIAGGLVLFIVFVKGASVYWRYLVKNKVRRTYNGRFDTLDTNHDGYISEPVFAQFLLDEYKVSSIRKSEDFPSAPFKFCVEDTSGLMSKRQYEQGFEIVEAFRDFQAGTALPLCLLLRAKYHDRKAKPRSKIGQVHPSPVPEVSPAGPSQSSTAPSETPKFCARKISVGSSAVSAKGLRSAVGLEDDTVLANMLKDPEHTIECEFLVAGDEDDIDNFYSTKNGTSGKQDDLPDHVKHSFQTGKYHGGSITESDYDTGNTGKKLADFHKHETSVLAGLVIWNVLVIRLYTSSSFRLFNAPLRSLLTNNGQTKSQHPLRFTVYMLTEGIKKLRAVEAIRDPVAYNTPMELWRGMADMEVDVQGPFLSQGGTEMAVMSTTCDKEVALTYSRSQRPLVFKYKTFGLSRGVSIQFLSLYPKEVEYVYPVPFQTSL
jgi:hypothetical protein